MIENGWLVEINNVEPRCAAASTGCISILQRDYRSEETIKTIYSILTNNAIGINITLYNSAVNAFRYPLPQT